MGLSRDRVRRKFAIVRWMGGRKDGDDDDEDDDVVHITFYK